MIKTIIIYNEFHKNTKAYFFIMYMIMTTIMVMISIMMKDFNIRDRQNFDGKDVKSNQE